MIIDTDSQYTNLLKDIENSDIFVIPILSDVHKHIRNNTLCALYVYSINSDNEYLLLYNHQELLKQFDFLTYLETFKNKIYCFNKKQFLHIKKIENIFDINVLEYLTNNDKPNLESTDTSAHSHFNRQYFNTENINSIIPAVKHFEKCSMEKDIGMNILFECQDTLDTLTYKIYNEKVTLNFYNIEKSGLYVDNDLFKKYFPDRYKYHINDTNLIYTDYNLFTSTGRPSNSFGGVNFAALNKEDGSREIFISRFDKGALVEFDYDAFHIKIIADLIGYKFPTNMTVYDYLGRQYYGKDSLTQEEIKESKNITFQLIYGGISEEFEQILFFKMLKSHIYNIWCDMKNNEFVESHLFKRKIYKKNITDINQFKLWNYIIQLMETEINSIVLDKLFNVLSKYKSQLILYTYDSFLFDMSLEDGKEFLKEVKEVIEDNGKFTTKIKYGANYNIIKGVNNEKK